MNRMHTGPAGVSLVKLSEVFVAWPYDDADTHWPRRRITDWSTIVGHATIGYGHLVHGPQEFPRDLTEPEASRLLASQLGFYEDGVQAACEHFGLEPTQNQFDALVDFAYNEGDGAVMQLVGHLMEGPLTEDVVRAKFVVWDKWRDHGVLVENYGLKLRRLKEAVLFCRAIFSDAEVQNVMNDVHAVALEGIAEFLNPPIIDPDGPEDPR